MKGTRIAKRYTVEEIDRALSATALFDGNTRAAAKALKGQGLDIPRTTLRDWVNGSRKDRYIELRDKLLPEIHAKVAEEHQELARANMEAEAAYVERILKVLPEISPRDLSTTARNLATAAGIHQDKTMTLRGLDRPAVAVNISFAEQVRSLAARSTTFFDAHGNRLTPEQAIEQGTPKAIEGTATELPSNEGTEQVDRENQLP